MDLPKDYRTLMATPTDYSIQDLAGGQFYYKGIKKGILTMIGNKCMDKLQTCSIISLIINIDGLPLFHSSKLQLRPILGLVNECKQFGPFVIGLFSGKSKPSSLDAYLQPLIDELKFIFEHGIEIYDKTLKLQLEAFVCDAPARSFLKGIKSHIGYNSCQRCNQHGEWNGRLIFADHRVNLEQMNHLEKC